MDKLCPNCQTVNPAAAQQCSVCGTPFAPAPAPEVGLKLAAKTVDNPTHLDDIKRNGDAMLKDRQKKERQEAFKRRFRSVKITLGVIWLLLIALVTLAYAPYDWRSELLINENAPYLNSYKNCERQIQKLLNKGGKLVCTPLDLSMLLTAKLHPDFTTEEGFYRSDLTPRLLLFSDGAKHTLTVVKRNKNYLHTRVSANLPANKEALSLSSLQQPFAGALPLPHGAIKRLFGPSFTQLCANSELKNAFDQLNGLRVLDDGRVELSFAPAKN